jgi:hypothetical protein
VIKFGAGRAEGFDKWCAGSSLSGRRGVMCTSGCGDQLTRIFVEQP